MELVLVRHTESDWNRERRYLGQSDRPLTPRGRRRAEALARRLARLEPDAVVSSGLARTDLLARGVAAWGAPRPSRDPRWRELDHGRWEGLTWEQVEARFPDAARRRWRTPWRSRAHGGESGRDLWRRVEPALAELVQRRGARRVVVVTHAGPIQLLVCRALGAPFESWSRVKVELGAVARLEWRAGAGRLLSLGATGGAMA